MEISSIDDFVDYDNDINNNRNNDNNDNTNDKNNNDFVPDLYFVTPKNIENIDDILLKKFEELGINVEHDIKYYFKLTGTYCVSIKDPEILKGLESLDYITVEPVGKVRALNSED